MSIKSLGTPVLRLVVSISVEHDVESIIQGILRTHAQQIFLYNFARIASIGGRRSGTWRLGQVPQLQLL